MSKTKFRNNKFKMNKTKKFKKMNCNPIVEGKTVLDDSCYTYDTLTKIKNSYNSYHTENKIVETEPKQLWNTLKTRLNSCDKEDCWLKEIKDEKLRKDIDEFSFAPDHPPEWNNNPDEWLSNYDILDVLKQYEKKHKNFKFIGPTPIDFDTRIPTDNKCVWEELCQFSSDDMLKKGKTKIGIVFNLDKHDESGSHWVSMFIDFDNAFLFYFDSAGDKIPDEVFSLTKRVMKQGKTLKKPIYFKLHQNHPFIHQKGNTECGMYSLFFIITMLTKKFGNHTLSNCKKVIQFFKSKVIPDEYVFKHRKIYFNS